MTAAIHATEPTTPARPARPIRWQPWALALICLLAAVLYAWESWDGDWGNTFYTAAVKSMSQGFTNFLFGAFDPAGVVTVDKPPMALWPQVFSVWIFGFHGWSVLLPQVIEGAATVFLLHRTVRRWAGEHVALLAALILALTPITVAINHVNNPDTLLVLWLVAAAYALTRALSGDRAPRWLLWCAFFLGCGFVTKMLAAWIVVPGFALAYWFGRDSSWRHKVRELAAATGVLLVSSFWWPLLHDLWPGAKPYVDNSSNGTALNLIFAYNGFGRIFGQGFGGRPSGGGGFGGGAADAFHRDAGTFGGRTFGGRTFGGGMFGGGTGIGRLFGSSVGGQIGWLIPLCLLVVVSVLVAGFLRRDLPRPDRGCWLLWGSWLLVMGLVFSFAQGIFHSYYTTALAPAIAAVAAAGLATFWRWYREPGAAWVLLPISVAGSAIWAYVLVERDAAWHGWAAPVVVVLGAAAVLTLVGARFGTGRRAGLALTGLALAGATLLVVPAIWSGATAFAGTRSGGAMAQAGPTDSRRGFEQAGLTAQDRRILAYAAKAAPGARITLALEEPSMQAAQWIIDSDVTVIGMGGFDGTDNAPTTAQLADWVRTGQLRFVLGQQQRGFARGGTASTQRDDWVRQHCAVVAPSVYGGSGQTLYSCTSS
jgi:4-amino-4-deoxy-L-arabinose transferase-like glycosyltransferase